MPRSYVLNFFRVAVVNGALRPSVMAHVAPDGGGEVGRDARGEVLEVGGAEKGWKLVGKRF